MTLKAAERQLPQFISVTYEVGSRGPDPHTSPLAQTGKINILQKEKYLTDRNMGRQGQSIWSLFWLWEKGETDSQGNEKRMKMIICMQSNMNK